MASSDRSFDQSWRPSTDRSINRGVRRIMALYALDLQGSCTIYYLFIYHKNTHARTHARSSTRAHSHIPTHRSGRSGCCCSMGRWRPTVTQLTSLFDGSLEINGRSLVHLYYNSQYVDVHKLQVAILARTSREMSLTVRIDWHYRTSCHEFASQFGLAIFVYAKTPQTSEKPGRPRQCLIE